MSGTPYDLVVVGAGPAGSVAAASALQQNPDLRVLLLDRSDFPRDKCCGDGIAAQAVDVLRTLGMDDVVDGWTPLRHLELASGTTAVSGPMRRDVHVVPRAVLDARLVAHAVRRGADLQRRRVRRIVPDDPRGVVVDGEVLAPVLIGADGAHSPTRAALAGPGRLPTPRRAIAVRGYAPTAPERVGQQVIRYGPRRQPSYAWAFDRGDGLSNVGYGELIDDGATSRSELLARLEELIPGSVAEDRAWTGHPLPLSGLRWQHPDGRCLLVGDAAGLINPMTGEGIYYAVATGGLAGRTAAAAVRDRAPERAGARYRADVRRLLAAHLRHTWAAGTLSRRSSVVDAGIRAARRDPRVFDALVDLGLGDGRISARTGAGLARELLRPTRPATTDPS